MKTDKVKNESWYETCFQGPDGPEDLSTLSPVQWFQVRCSRPGIDDDNDDASHDVSPFGFLILEAIEKELGTTEQMVASMSSLIS